MGAYDDGGMTNAMKAARITPPTPTPVTKVTVEKGDTLSSIAKEYGTTVKDILAANPKFTEDPKYKNGNMIWSGTTVKLPTKSTSVGSNFNPGSFRLFEEKDRNSSGTTTTTPPTTTTTTPPTTTTTNTDPPLHYTDSIPSWTYRPSSTSNDAASTPAPPPVKTATPDLILYDDEGNELEAFADVLFEQLGGQELLTIARHDTVNGQDVLYQPIKNLGILQNEFNPNSLIKLQDSLFDYFNNYDIDLFDKIPKVGNGIDGKNVYLDGDGNLIIELINLAENEQVDIEIANDGTIYETEI